jgi:hypothetical protein
MSTRATSICATLSGLIAIGAVDCRADPTEATSTTTTIPLQQARIQLGQNYPVDQNYLQPTAGVQTAGLQLDAVPQEHVLPGIPENSSQAEIPFGFAGVAWTLRHPSEAERLFLPVQN